MVGNSATLPAVSGVIEVGEARLHYDAFGTGRPVVFIHAGVADSRMWDAQFEEIENSRLIRFDLRGYGKSTLGSERFTNRDDLIAVLDHLQIERALLVGCSIGGNIALQVAASTPERLEGLILVGADSPGFDPGIDYESPEWPLAIEAFKAEDWRRVAELDAEMWLAGRGRALSDLDPETVDLFVNMDMIALENETGRNQLDDGERLERLPEVDVPVEVIVGARDIPQLIAAADDLVANLGQRAPVVIEDTAHLPSMDRPMDFNSAITGFLATM